MNQNSNFSEDSNPLEPNPTNQNNIADDNETPEQVKERRSNKLYDYFRRKSEAENVIKPPVDLEQIMPEPSGPHVRLQMSLINVSSSNVGEYIISTKKSSAEFKNCVDQPASVIYQP